MVGTITARIWSATTGKCLHVLEHESAVPLALFGRHGDLVATASRDGNVQFWSAETGAKIGGMLLHPGDINIRRFYAGRRTVCNRGRPTNGCMWNVRDGSLRSKIAVGDAGSAINCMAISPDGERGVASAGDSHACRLESEERRDSIRSSTSRLARSPRHSPVTRPRSAPESADGHALLWNAKTGQLVRKLPHAAAVKQVAFTPDSQRLVTMTEEGAFIWLLEAAPPDPIAVKHEGLKGTSIDPAGPALLTIGSDHTVRSWSLHDGRALGAPLFHADSIAGARFSPDGYRCSPSPTMEPRGSGIARIGCVNGDSTTSAGEVHAVAALGSATILAWTNEGVVQFLRAGEPPARDARFELSTRLTAACLSPDANRASVG